MPLVKTSGVLQTLKGAPSAAAKHISENKVPYIIGGVVTTGGLGTAYYSRMKEREREDALVRDILSRNMEKTAFLPLVGTVAKGLWGVAKGLGGAAKGAAGVMGGGLKNSVKGFASHLENAGYTGAANAINTAGRFGMNAWRAGAGKAKELGGKAWETAKKWGGVASSVPGQGGG